MDKPVLDHAQENIPAWHHAGLMDNAHPILDALNRPLRDLRISVTDRCNFRCLYCMPKQVFGKNFRFIHHKDMLSFEEIARLARCFTNLGITKIRLTGGEPLLRRHIERLIAYLADLKRPDGKPLDLTLTTNGSVLAQKAQLLFDAGLKRITISLDAIDNDIFTKINDVGFPVSNILQAIEHAVQMGFSPVKVNAVIRKGINENQILPLVRHFRNTPVILRFIEYMDVGSTPWNREQIVPASQIAETINRHYPIEPLNPNYPGETAERWHYQDGGGELGIISSITKPFCADCTRIRLSTEGRIYPCLFSAEGFDLRELIRSGQSDEQIAQAISRYWQNRSNRYSELRKELGRQPAEHKVEMHYIGG
ncbi:MAG: GTP 3',8-cyclase MoaA [Oxalobacter sp.]|nr:GTP 3',8-cyclase MoaA [Oxalobacter sp.]